MTISNKHPGDQVIARMKQPLKMRLGQKILKESLFLNQNRKNQKNLSLKLLQYKICMIYLQKAVVSYCYYFIVFF